MAEPTAPDHVTVLVPRTLMSVTGDRRRIELEISSGETVADVLNKLASSYPVFDRRVRDETGALRRYVNLYLDGADIRRIGGISTPIDPGQEIQIIQSVAGG
jgi:molybdopterin converting factor small subunit